MRGFHSCLTVAPQAFLGSFFVRVVADELFVNSGRRAVCELQAVEF